MIDEERNWIQLFGIMKVFITYNKLGKEKVFVEKVKIQVCFSREEAKTLSVNLFENINFKTLFVKLCTF